MLLVRRPAGGSTGPAGVRVFAAWTHHSDPWLETTVLDDLAGVHDLDLEALAAGRSPGLTPHHEPVLAVCTHGRHDTCCAERGRPVAAGLAEAFPEETWEASHLGGDRFAANLLVLPHGLYFGRLEPATARGVARLLAAGELDLDHLRGRSGLATSLQAAEAALRRYIDERRLDAVRFVSRAGARRADRGEVRRGRPSLRRHRDVHPGRGPPEAHLPSAARESSHAPRGPRDPGAVMRRAAALLGASHPGPAFAVTVLAGLLAGAVGLGPAQVALVVAAVLAGQLSIGWSNDLIDLARDRTVGRPDKPLVDGSVSERTVRIACASAAVLTVPLSLACGWLAGAVHLLLVVAGWTYNLGVKATPWSWLPYAVAFGGLPVFVSLTDNPDQLPPLWLPLAGALLGVGAHVVNVLPDLADDAATGVRGLPHRLGARWSQVVAAAVLVAAAVVIVVGAPVDSEVVAVVALVVTAGLAGVALLAHGRAPFRAAIGMALVDVVMLVWAR